jgi:plastocyanin
VVKDNEVCAKIDHYDERLVVGADKGIKDAVISLTNIDGGQSLEAMGTQFVLDQRGCTFRPHVLLVPVNTPVQVLNNDGILHNFHTYSMRNGRVNIAQPPVLKRLKRAFKYPEKISVRCDLHGWMHAWIIVVEHPYHAVTDANGNFTMPDIPPGTYTVQSWQEQLGEQTAKVTVAAGENVTVDFKYRPKVSSETPDRK